MMQRLRWLTAGESHGKGLLGILDGLPAGIPVTEDDIFRQLVRRQQGHGRGKRQQIERDRAEIYCGVRQGKTLGSPVGLILPNKDWENWQTKMSVEPLAEGESVSRVTLPRPGHADLAGIQKFGFDDTRNVLERSSARETAMRVALSAVARQCLTAMGIELGSCVIQIHDVVDNSDRQSLSPDEVNRIADASPVRCIDAATGKRMMSEIDKAKTDGDSVGGVFEVVAYGVPYGLGSNAHWDRKLESRIAAAMMSIPAMKGVEVGAGFSSAGKFGSEIHDEIQWSDETYSRPTNRAGGIEGGMSNAQPIVVRVAMKPLPTLIKPLRSVDIETKRAKDAHKERTDACAVPAASVIGEAMLCLVLVDALLEKFGGDSLDQLQQHVAASGKY